MLDVFLKNEMLSPDLSSHSMRDVTFEKKIKLSERKFQTSSDYYEP